MLDFSKDFGKSEMPAEEDYPKLIIESDFWKDSLYQFPWLLRFYRTSGLREYALFQACDVGNVESVRIILDYGINVNSSQKITNTFSRSPLEIASRGGHLELVQFLVGRGADINSGDDSYRPIWSACGQGYFKVVKFLMEHGARLDLSDLIAACQGDNLEIVKYLLGKFNITNEDYLLRIVIRCNRLPVVEYILKRRRANLNTALESIKAYTDIDICLILVDYGAPISKTFLNLAHSYNRTDIIQMFS